MNALKIKDKNRELQYRNMIAVLGKYNNNPENPAGSLTSRRMRSIMNSYRLAEAYKPGSKVAYVGEQFPTEIVFAFNLLAWNIESMSILFAQADYADEFLHLTQENSLSRDICSFLRGPFGVMLANCYPYPDIILANDQPCDCLAKLEYMASKLYRCPFFTLNTPNYINDDSLAYLLRQCNDMIYYIESSTNIRFREENFRKVVDYANEAKDYYCKTIELHRKAMLPGVSRELHEIFSMNCFGLKETVRICRTLYEEALELYNHNTDRKKRKRILWVGQVPESTHELLGYMENDHEVIFWAPLWEGNLLMLDSKNPLKSIAERAILYHWNSERMKQNISGICDTYELDAIIISNIWGCRNMLGINPMVRELANERRLKFLTINLDLVDRKNFSFAQMKNRIDAFLEIL
ncbi:MAG: 2-hydroxyacyl-CoA dehydratase [Spirochaetales bacterium]|nr:2-hydroxyacyl-CoA dehydratase [Spirochaetales bacterium]